MGMQRLYDASFADGWAIPVPWLMPALHLTSFTQLIQRPRNGATTLIRLPRVWDIGFEICIASVARNSNAAPRRTDRCTILCHQQDSRWVCDESEFLKYRSFPFRWRFLVTLYKSSMPTHRAWPKHACIFRLGSHLELSPKPNQWCHKTR
jgi:hypothetical protein